MRKNTMLSHKKILDFATVREYQMSLGLFMQVWKGNKSVEFRAVAQKMENNDSGYFLPHHVYEVKVAYQK